MGNIASQFATAFRDFVVEGIASSGPHDVIKEEVRAIGPLIEQGITTAGLGALVDVIKDTKANLDADLAHPADTVALVFSDATQTNNDLYVKTGASGAGAWTNTGALFSIISSLAQPFVDQAEAAAADLGGLGRASTSLLDPASSGWALDRRVNQPNGALSVMAGWDTTPFIPVVSGQTYITNVEGFFVQYNSSEGYVGSLTPTTVDNLRQITATADGFIRGSIQRTGNYARSQIFFVAGTAAPAEIEPTGNLVKPEQIFSVSAAQVQSLFEDAAIPPSKLQMWEESPNKANPVGRVDGFFMATNGTLTANSTYSVWPAFRVVPDQVWTANQSMRFVTFFDAGRRAMTAVSLPNPVSQFTVPAGARFAVPTSNAPTVSSFAIELGSTVPAWSPYGWRPRSTLPTGEPVNWGVPAGADLVEELDTTLGGSGWREESDLDVPAFYGLERLRETRQRLRSLRGGVTGLAARLNIALIGDSWTHDNGRYSSKVARALWGKYHPGDPNEDFGPIGLGWISFKGAGSGSFPNGAVYWNNYMTGSGVWTSENGTAASPDTGSETSSEAGAYLQPAVDFDYSRGLAYQLYAEGGAGVVRYRWSNAGAWTEINLAALAAGIQVINLTGTPGSGSGRFRIEVVTGAPKLYGMTQVHPTAQGVIVNKLGATGTRAQQWATVNAAQFQVGMAALAPNLISIMHATNDQNTRTKAQFKADVTTIIDRGRTALPAADILLVAPCENQRVNSVPMSEYAAALYEIARDDRDVAFLNLQPYFGVAPADYAAGSARPWFNVDGIHPEPSIGGYAIEDAFLGAIGERAA